MLDDPQFSTRISPSVVMAGIWGDSCSVGQRAV